MFSDNSIEQRLSRTSQMSSKVEEDPQKGPWRQGKSQPLANFLQPRKMMCGFCDVRAVQCSLSLVACFCARLESEVKWQGSQITSHKRLHSHTHTHAHTHTCLSTTSGRRTCQSFLSVHIPTKPPAAYAAYSSVDGLVFFLPRGRGRAPEGRGGGGGPPDDDDISDIKR